jgi:uncharacterized protein YcbK (DUF882 family)
MRSYFKPEEFECKCGCGLNNVNDVLIQQLNIARHSAGVPFIITSATRCSKHNKSVGGVDSSSHTTGYAVDISAPTPRARFKILQALVMVGFNRIGIAGTFIHVDNDKTKPEDVTWLY